MPHFPRLINKHSGRRRRRFKGRARLLQIFAVLWQEDESPILKEDGNRLLLE